MNSHEIRKLFTAFFAERGHEVVPSASLVPHDDPTLLFTNAGMVPFKDVFTNRRKAPYTRAVSVQRCVRAGGKHNDLENVGYTTRHHTLFEMLGNFSFGDYFKQDAISYAWSFLIEVLKLEPEKLWITVHDSDQEAADLWEKYVPVERIIKLGDEDNYWAMGPTGPNGPCSEIYYDHGPDVEGGRPGSPTAEGDRYVEIWNLVFMQYETLASGKRIKLPKPCVDTGLGLERLAAVMNGVTSGYETDVFIPLLVAAGVAAGISDQNEAIANTSLRVIADHVRSTSMLIVDGVLPSNEGRGYVLRRIIRRALRHTKKLGMANNSFSALSQTLANQMQDDWPALYAERTEIAATLEKETTLFIQTLKQGTKLLEDALQKQTQSGRGVKRISGDVIFKLYDTYGFPPDLTADIARERGLDMDLAGFEAAMRKQMELGKAGHKFSANALSAVGTGETTNFIGYNDHSMEAAVVRALYRLDMQVEEAGVKGEAKDVIVGVDELKQDEHGIVILEQTCFYAKSGGQIGDIGELNWNGGSFNITDTTKNADCIQHQGRMSVGCLRVGEAVEGAIDAERRVRIRRAHSATHLLHAALRKVLGDHVVQKGSLVEIDRLTFDFSHTNAVSQAELEEIEGLVNAQVRGNSVVEIEVMAPDAARSSGALALFGEKYGDAVRVLTMGDDNFSKELCGGTHVRRTGDIGTFQIVGESGIAAGIRRIEAVTGEVAVEAMTRHKLVLQRVASRLKTDIATLLDKIKQNQEENKTLRKVTQRLSAKLSEQLVSEMATEAEDIGGIKLLASEIERSLETNNVMGMMDQLKLKLGDSVILLAWIESGRVNLVASVSQNVTNRIKASDLVNVAAKIVGAKGGGRAELARAGGGEQVELVSQAITAARDFGRRKLSA